MLSTAKQAEVAKKGKEKEQQEEHDPNGPPTQRQIDALLELGFKRIKRDKPSNTSIIERNRSRRRRKITRHTGRRNQLRNGSYIQATSSWLQKNMTWGQAGAVIREMRYRLRKHRMNAFKLPARPFLNTDERYIANTLEQQIITNFKKHGIDI